MEIEPRYNITWYFTISVSLPGMLLLLESLQQKMYYDVAKDFIELRAHEEWLLLIKSQIFNALVQ